MIFLNIPQKLKQVREEELLVTFSLCLTCHVRHKEKVLFIHLARSSANIRQPVDRFRLQIKSFKKIIGLLIYINTPTFFSKNCFKLFY